MCLKSQQLSGFKINIELVSTITWYFGGNARGVLSFYRVGVYGCRVTILQLTEKWATYVTVY